MFAVAAAPQSVNYVPKEKSKKVKSQVKRTQSKLFLLKQPAIVKLMNQERKLIKKIGLLCKLVLRILKMAVECGLI